MQLREHVTISEDRGAGGERLLVIHDVLTRRRFALPAEAAPLVTLLKAGCDEEALAQAAGAGWEPGAVARFVEQLRGRHVLEDRLPEEEVRRLVADEHRDARRDALGRAVRQAAGHVPFYRERMAGVDLSLGDAAALLRVPVTRAADVRAYYPDGFVPDSTTLQSLLEADAVVRAASSGTSAGDRLLSLHTRDVWRRQMIAGASLNDDLFPRLDRSSAVLTSMHCADPEVCVTRFSRMEDRIRAGTRLLLLPPEEPGAPTRAETTRALEELHAHAPVWIDCNPSYLATLTYAAVDAGMALPRLEVITCSFEFMSGLHRRWLQQAWGCPVYDRYSTSEMGSYVAIECERGALHVNDAFYWAEVVRDGRAARPRELGHLVVTTLQEVLPLVRYETRDLVFAAAEEPCPCGSPTARLGCLAGRKRDVLLAADGTPRTAREVDDALMGVDGLRFYQVTQPALGRFRLKVVAAPGAPGSAVAAAAGEALRQVMGPAQELRTETGRYLYASESGKFQLTRCEVPDFEERLHTCLGGP